MSAPFVTTRPFGPSDVPIRANSPKKDISILPWLQGHSCSSVVFTQEIITPQRHTPLVQAVVVLTGYTQVSRMIQNCTVVTSGRRSYRGSSPKREASWSLHDYRWFRARHKSLRTCDPRLNVQKPRNGRQRIRTMTSVSYRP